MKRLCSTLAAIAIAGAGLVTFTASPASACSPTVSGISPTVGFTGGNTTVTLAGTCLTGETSVTFGAASGTVNAGGTATSVTVVSPSHAAGAVTVTLHGAGDAAAPSQFTYYSPPSITSILPTQGPQGGGESVAVTGNNFVSGGSTASVKFGSVAAASTSGVTDTSLTTVSPAQPPGTVSLVVTVTLSSGEAAPSTGVNYVVVPAPVVSSVLPTSGPPTGGTDITITGLNFQAGAQVFLGPFDGTASTCPNPVNSAPLCTDASAFPVDVVSATEIVATTRAGIPGLTNLVVLNPDGQNGALKSGAVGAYSFTGSGPAISTVLPSSGSSLGGMPFTINGSGFLSGASVVFATVADAHPATATGAVVNGAGTQITGTTAPHAAGLVGVTVNNLGGGTVTDASSYTYNAASTPTITGTLSPTTGTSLGGTHVTISGTNFAAGAQVTFGGNASPSVAFINSMSLSAVTPGHPGGAVTVTVTNPDGQSVSKSSGFVYAGAPAPTISSVSPNTGDGGQAITITGSGFATTAAGFTNAVAPALVTVGPVASCMPQANPPVTTSCLQAPATPPMVVNTTTINGVVPDFPGGPQTVTVTNPDGQTATRTFTYTGPTGTLTLTGISPSSDPTLTTLGHTTVALTGSNFVTGAVVTFAPEPLAGKTGSAGTKAKSTTVTDSSDISAITPAGVYGLVDVTVTNPGGATATLKNAITFLTAPQPAITTVSPNTGAGLTPVTITGTGFANTNGVNTNATGPASVQIGTTPLIPPATPPAVTSATTISGKVPNLTGGAYDVSVMNPDGQGVILSAGFTVPSDAINPLTTATGTLGGGGSYTFGAWANSHVKVTLSASDNGGGDAIQSITYSSSGATTIAPTTVNVSSTFVNFNTDGASTLTFHATDVAGNVESTETETIKVDTVAPTVTMSASNVSGPYSAGTPSGSNVTVVFNCTDATSGVSTLTFSSASTTTTSGTNPLSVTVTSDGTGQSVTGTCTDHAGNVTNSTFSPIDITKTAPTITAAAYIAGSPYTAGVWTNEAVTVVFSCTPISEADQVATLTPPVQVSGPTTNMTVSGTCTDTVGNSSTVTFGTATAGIDIDLTLPVASATATTTNNNNVVVPYTAGTWTNHSVVVTFHCTDTGPNQSGVFSIDSPVTVSTEGDTSGVSGGCVDVAGNTADPPAFFGPILIDETAPVCNVTITPNPIHPATRTLLAVKATVFVTDAASGPNGFKLVSVTSNHPTTAASDITGFAPGTASVTGKLRTTLGRIYTFTYQGFDVAGNSSALCTTHVTVSTTG